MASGLKLFAVFAVIFTLSAQPSEEIPRHRLVLGHQQDPRNVASGKISATTQPSSSSTVASWVWLDPLDIKLGIAHLKKKYPGVDWDKEIGNLKIGKRTEHDDQSIEA